MTLQLNATAGEILKKLTDNGFDAYAVGGCVRDLLICKTPYDYDITTSARPDEIKKTFSDYKTVDTGIKHGTVTVIYKGLAFEITTFRSDGTYSDGRHPDSVSFSDSIIEDLKRRDFTMNAIAYNDISGLVDPFDGKSEELEKYFISTPYGTQTEYMKMSIKKDEFIKDSKIDG